ncbi:MAG: hypothetical protein ACI9OJ_002450 [Myxococcota bacterium]|jgi:hypothetical protein
MHGSLCGTERIRDELVRLGIRASKRTIPAKVAADYPASHRTCGWPSRGPTSCQSAAEPPAKRQRPVRSICWLGGGLAPVARQFANVVNGRQGWAQGPFVCGG